ncbi:rhamnogalacturonan acetylesterase [Chitinophaga horti]|uniref:Rhamnogalacturonan acetylesterase n=1 Tax=Chitinophaga horti TaxID=2920382 RepID=A0ABY6J992_9BACT|nr:rhamnogalacturonan acetylesterase [Chitinophaga horti]UYQ94892.1 rhamnogalacturonan acetylesterase [Chitinophaga horti]
MKLQLLLLCTLLSTYTFAQQPVKKVFLIGPGKGELNTDALYTKERGYGWDDTTGLRLVQYKDIDHQRTRDYITAPHPFSFSVDVPEGEYDVVLYTGDRYGRSATTVRAECRRLMLYNIRTRKNEIRASKFTVHVRDSLIRQKGVVTGKVKLKDREHEYLHWDNRLTLEFSDSLPKICEIHIMPAEAEHVAFLAGNSTVVDQSREPWCSWGQILPAFYDARDVAIANYAESGETLHSFRAAGRLDKIFSQMRGGDYLFIEFGHNDQKRKGENVGAFTSFKKELEYYVRETRKHEGVPVLITPVNRRSFDSTGKITNSLGDFPAAVRQVAKEMKVALIDLNAMTKEMYEAWGPEKSLKAFVHYPAGTYPGQKEALKDNTHFSAFGAWQIAKCVANALADKHFPFNRRGGVFRKFDHAKPDDPATFYWPASGFSGTVKPDGN